MSEQPISDTLRNALVTRYKANMLPGVSDVTKGINPGEIIFTSLGSEVVCLVTEDSKYVYFRLPEPHKNQRVLKEHFFRDILRWQPTT